MTAAKFARALGGAYCSGGCGAARVRYTARAAEVRPWLCGMVIAAACCVLPLRLQFA